MAMTRFRYKSVTPVGELVQGEMEAVTRRAVIERLHNDGHTPIRADEITEGSALRLFPDGFFRRTVLSGTDTVLLTRELATLLGAGVPLEGALVILVNLADDGPKHRLIQAVLERVRGGSSLADALEPYRRTLPGFYIAMVRAGEAGGALEIVLTRLAEALERAQSLKATVRSAMYYPVIVLIVAVISLIILLTQVVPAFRPLFEGTGAALPTSTKVIVALGEWLTTYWWLTFAVPAGLVPVLRNLYRRPTVRLAWDRTMLKIPLIGELITKLEVARFSRTLGTLLSNGVSILNALAIAVDTLGNRAMAQEASGLAASLKKGDGLARPLMASGVFPRLAVQLIHVGEEGGQLEDMLLRVASIYDEETRQALQRMLALLVPMITILLGLIVAAVVSSMLTAILSTYDLAF
ncbi:MAG: Type secretion system protein [Rhodospirillales bacterium]|nr:Type secretion system protein [Rhodospirillales bacterium]